MTVVHNDMHTHEQFLKLSVFTFCVYFYFSLDCFVPVSFVVFIQYYVKRLAWGTFPK